MNYKKYIFKSIALMLCVVLMAANGIVVCASETIGNTYYVSVGNGIDAETSGSAQAPFKTIQYAASRMQAGDVCIIKEGIYRETVTVSLNGSAAKPIVFRAEENADVVITGCDEITGWTNYQGDIYTADMDWDIYSGNGNMIFADGKMCTEARWPNSTKPLDITTYATVDAVNTSSGFRIVDADLPTDVDLGDGMIGIATGYGYYNIYGDIAYHDIPSDTIRYSMPAWVTGGYLPTKGNTYYITRTLAALDAEEEWYKDVSNNKLYFMAPGKVNPNQISVEAKKREYAVDLSGASYVTIEGINIKGANIKTDSNTNNCTIKNCVIESMDYKLMENETGKASAIVIDGSYNTVTGCEIENSYGGGIKLAGSYNRVINNSIHDVNLQHTNVDSGVYITGTHQLVSHNSIYNLAREAIGGRFKKSVISYNDLHDGELISRDGGIIYLSNNNYLNSEIHHNLVYNNSGSGFQAGIYYDNSASGLITYDNVVSNINGRPFVLNTPHSNSIVANNTFAVSSPIECWPPEDKMSNIKIFNNVFFSDSMFDADVDLSSKDVVYDGNVLGASGMLNGDYTPASNAALIDNAVRIPGITNSYTGNEPDCGAYEYGVSKWQAGCDLTTDSNEVLVFNEDIPFKNVLANNEFESGLEGWTVVSGGPTIINQSAWSYDDLFTILGSKSLMLKAGDKISQTITGLKPNMTYTFTVNGRINGKFVKATDYKSLGGSFQYASGKAENVLYKIDDGDYAVYSVDFGNGLYDNLSVGAYAFPKGTMSSSCTVSIYLDSLSGTKIAEYKNGFLRNELYNDNHWAWPQKSFSAVTGVHDVYVKFEGAFDTGSFGGLIFNSSTNKDTITISAKAAGETSVGTISTSEWKEIPDSIDIETDALGAATVIIEKQDGNYFGYIDDLSFMEKYVQGEEMEPIYVKFDSIKYMDIYGNRLSTLKKNEINVVEVTVNNTKMGTSVVTGKLESCYSDGTVYDSAKIQKTIDGQALGAFGLGLEAPDDDGAYLLLSVVQGGGMIEHKITSGEVESEFNATGEVVVKSVSIVNSSGATLQAVKKGAINTVCMTVENCTDEPITADCLVALYDFEGRMVDVKILPNKQFSANEETSFSVASIDVPAEGTFYIRTTLWNNISKMEPYSRMYSFR